MTKLLNVTRALAAALVLAGAAAAQEQAPEAGRLFDGLKDQFTIVLPKGWTVYDVDHETAAFTEKPNPYGLVLFLAESALGPGEKVFNRDNPQAVLRVIRGDVPSFYVERLQAGKGMSCSRLTRSAKSEIALMVGKNPVFGAPRTSEIEIAGCQGLKVEGSGQGWRLEVRAVSDGKTLYLFSLRNSADNFARNLGAYETALATLQLASGPAGASGAMAASAPASPSAKGSFDGRAWKLGHTGRTPKMEITEVPAAGTASEQRLQGVLSDGTYTSPRHLFSVVVPKAPNWAGIPYELQEATVTGDANYDSIAFYVKDFGQVMLVSVRRIPRAVGQELAKQDRQDVLKFLADKALSDWRQEFPGKPIVLEDNFVETAYGQGLLCVFKVPRGSLLQKSSRKGFQPFDVVIGVMVAMRNDHYIYGIAENDFEPLETEDLKDGLGKLFAGISVPDTPQFETNTEKNH